LIPASSKVFISYRREDSGGYAGRIYDRLSSRLGSQAVFFDFEIPIGANLVTAIEENVAQAKVLVAIIGPNWLKARDAEGKRRLNDPDDFVRLEINAALHRNIPVIPVLVDGASPPRVEELPDDLKILARRQSIEVSHSRFDSDMERLSQSIRARIELE
jgi:TIR domain